MAENTGERILSSADVSRRRFLSAAAVFAASLPTAAVAQGQSQEYVSSSELVAVFPPVKANGVDANFQFVGAAHAPRTFLNPKLRQSLEEQIKSATFVTLEIFTPSIQAMVWELIRIGDAEIPTSLLKQEGFFFAGCAYLAWKHKKDIVVTNPQGAGDGIGETLIEIEHLLADRRISLVQTAAIAGVAPLLGAAGVGSTRRWVLKAPIAAAAAVATTVFGGATLDKIETDQIYTKLVKLLEKYKSNNPHFTEEDVKDFGHALPHIIRWRDRQTSRGLLKAMKIYDTKGTVAGIFGTYHAGMRSDVRDGHWVDTDTYPYHRLLGTSTIRKFTWSQAGYKAEEPVPF